MKITQIDAEIKRQINDNKAINIITQPGINRLGINIIKDGFQVDRNIKYTLTNL